MKILIDNGHGLNTPGKRSPDGTFLEASYNREIAKRIVIDLIDRGYDAQLLVPEDHDIPLSERVKRVNEICLTYEPSRTTRRHARPNNRPGRPRPAISSSSPAHPLSRRPHRKLFYGLLSIRPRLFADQLLQTSNHRHSRPRNHKIHIILKPCLTKIHSSGTHVARYA